MIWTVVRVGLLRMWHGRTEILLTFQLDQDQRPTRTLEVGLSGESFIRRGSE